MHMIANYVSRQALKSSSLQWIVYCWLFSAKSLMMYYHVIPDSKQGYSVRSIVSLMCLTPLLYMLWTFRALRQLFRRADNDMGKNKGKIDADQKRKKREHVTLDVVLLLD